MWSHTAGRPQGGVHTSNPTRIANTTLHRHGHGLCACTHASARVRTQQAMHGLARARFVTARARTHTGQPFCIEVGPDVANDRTGEAVVGW